MRKTRLNTEIILFGEGQFYIYSYDEHTWQFRDIKTHLVISTSTGYFSLVSNIVKILDKYKTYTNYLNAVNSMSETGVTPIQLAKRQKEYESNPNIYKEELQDIITYHNKLYSTKANKTRVRNIVPIAPTPAPIVDPNAPKLKKRSKYARKITRVIPVNRTPQYE